MPWFYLFKDDTGRLLSETSERPAALPAGVRVLQLPSRPPESKMWDEATRTFVDRPLKVIRDHIVEILQRAELAGLSPAQIDALRADLSLRFGQERFYS